MFRLMTNRALTWLFSPSDNLDRDQDRALRRILTSASKTDISQKYGFAGIRSVKEYQEKCPVHQYRDLKPYWQETERGKADVVFHGTPRFFALTSGTTGAQKRVPVNDSFVESYRGAQLTLLSVYLSRNRTSRVLDSKGLIITGRSRITQTSAGIPCGMMSGIALETMNPILRRKALPTNETLNIADWDEKMVQMVREIAGQRVAYVFGIPSVLLPFLIFARQTLTREQFQYFAAHVEVCVVSGVDCEIYREAIHSALGKKVDFLNLYAASEGLMGYQISGTSLFRLFTERLFFEFLPFSEYQRGKYEPRKTITDLSEDEEYVLLLTNGSGAFSYVIGDVLRCARAGRIPLFELAGRTTLMLNVVTEKTTVEAIEKVMGAISRELGECPGEFVVTVKREGRRPNYVWVLQECPTWRQRPVEWLGNRLDELLCEHNAHYASFIGSQLAPSEVLFVDSGFFQSWLSARGVEGGQQKVPRIVPELSEVESYLKG
jgi:GH3 auxin-responsive promoter